MRRIRRLRGAPALFLVGVVAVIFALARPTGGSGNRTGVGGAELSVPVAADRADQELAALTASQEAFRGPGAAPFERVGASRPITGERTVLPVLRTVAHDGAEWLKVRLPGRPNGVTGWIEQVGAKLEYTPWRIVVSTAGRRVYAYDHGRIVRSFPAVVAAPATPTPTGQYFVEENVALAPSAVGYPYALALSARSNVYQEFDGGPGQIALHGLGNVGGTLGSATSHGCIRLDSTDITWLAKHIDPGVPVTIH